MMRYLSEQAPITHNLFADSIPTRMAAQFIYGLISKGVISPLTISSPKSLEDKIKQELPHETRIIYELEQIELIKKLCAVIDELLKQDIPATLIIQTISGYCMRKIGNLRVLNNS